jgi:hypothetical protein
MISLIVLLLFPLAVQYERGFLWSVLLTVTGILPVFFLLDMIANRTELALLFWDWPAPYELTISQRLMRLQHECGWRARMARPLVGLLNYFSPYGDHIK